MSASPIETDALVIGAGPVGLFQAFQLGLLEIPCHIVDTLPHAGGQCVERGIVPPVWNSANAPGGDEKNAAYLKKYRPLVKCL